MKRIPLAATAAAALLPCLSAQTTAVSPADRAQLEGSSYSHYPLGRFDTRLQQLHADLPGGMVLSGHAYRRDAVQLTGAAPAFASDMEVTLSLSPRTPATASATFANNQGPSPVAVLPRTVLAFPSTTRPGLDPSPSFDLLVPYQLPFVLPAQGGTLCVDTTIYSNVSSAGQDRNLSVYLDAHEGRTDGRAEQPGFRLGQGCPPPGRTTSAYATLTLWHLGAAMQLDLAMRNGVPQGQPLVTLGLRQTNLPLGGSCALLGSAELWYMPIGSNDGSGSFDGSVALPVLPPGYRIFCQTGSIDLQTGGYALGDLSALVTPPAAPTNLPAVRIANASDHTAATGTVSPVATVTRFY